MDQAGIWRDILESPAEQAARRLLGYVLERTLPDGTVLSGMIVETEAYDQSDAASHSYRRRTPRTDAMFGPAGHLYVYFTYGMHYCCNIVTGPEGHGSAVLIRALQPLNGVEEMSRLRGGRTGTDLTNGPAKICQALRIDKTWNGHDLRTEPIRLISPPSGKGILAKDIVASTRIGITRDTDRLWRFYVRGNPYVSRV